MRVVIGLFVDSLGEAVIGLFDGFFEQSTRPQVTAAFFVGDGGAYQTVASISCLLLVGTTSVAVAVGVFAGEPLQAAARAARDIPLAMLAIVGFPWLVEQLLVLTDQISTIMIPRKETLERLMNALAAPPERTIPGVFVASMTFMTTVLVFIELVVRNALTLIMTAMAPLSFAAMTTDRARSAARQVVKVTVAVAFAKPAIFIALRIGIDFLEEEEDPLTPSGWGRYLTAMSIVAIAAFMPFVVWKLLPLAETYVLAQGVSRAPFRAATQGAQMAYWGHALSSGRAAGSKRGPDNGQPTGDPDPRPSGGIPGGSRSLPDPAPGTRRRRHHRNPPAAAQPEGPAESPGPGPRSGADTGRRRPAGDDAPHQGSSPSAGGRGGSGHTPPAKSRPEPPPQAGHRPPPTTRQPPGSPSGPVPGPPLGWRRRRPAGAGGAATPAPEGPKP